jgi:hypothetical protein
VRDRARADEELRGDLCVRGTCAREPRNARFLRRQAPLTFLSPALDSLARREQLEGGTLRERRSPHRVEHRERFPELFARVAAAAAAA